MKKNAKTLETEINSENLLVLKCDVSNEKEVINMMNQVQEKFGNIDYLVNNTGTFIDNLIIDFNIDDFKKSFRYKSSWKSYLY